MTQTLDCIKEVFESPPPTAAPVPPRENPVPKPPSGSPLPKADPPKEEEPVFRIQDEDRKDGDYDPFSDSMF